MIFLYFFIIQCHQILWNGLKGQYPKTSVSASSFLLSLAWIFPNEPYGKSPFSCLLRNRLLKLWDSTKTSSCLLYSWISVSHRPNQILFHQNSYRTLYPLVFLVLTVEYKLLVYVCSALCWCGWRTNLDHLHKTLTSEFSSPSFPLLDPPVSIVYWKKWMFNESLKWIRQNLISSYSLILFFS